MNPRAKKFYIKPCVICGFLFSDKHHLYPRNRGGEKTLMLCPNHHRAANIIQVMVEHYLQTGDGFESVAAFAQAHFDEGFNAIVWKLIDAHCYEEKRVADKIYGYSEG